LQFVKVLVKMHCRFQTRFTYLARTFTEANIMPNHQQLLFLASFVGVLSSLILISNYLGAKLRAAGYDVSRIILIGLDTNSSAAPASKFALPWGSNSNMTTQSTYDLKDIQERGYIQAAALLLALLSSIFIYLKFDSTSEYFAFITQSHVVFKLLFQSVNPCSIPPCGKSSLCQKRLSYPQIRPCKILYNFYGDVSLI
jgi:hypothetical protein